MSQCKCANGNGICAKYETFLDSSVPNSSASSTCCGIVLKLFMGIEGRVSQATINDWLWICCMEDMFPHAVFLSAKDDTQYNRCLCQGPLRTRQMQWRFIWRTSWWTCCARRTMQWRCGPNFANRPIAISCECLICVEGHPIQKPTRLIPKKMGLFSRSFFWTLWGACN